MTHVRITLEWENNRQKAVGFNLPDELGIFWLPKSQIRNIDALLASEPGYRELVVVEIPEWLAIKKSLDRDCEEIEEELEGER